MARWVRLRCDHRAVDQDAGGHDLEAILDQTFVVAVVVGYIGFRYDHEIHVPEWAVPAVTGHDVDDVVLALDHDGVARAIKSGDQHVDRRGGDAHFAHERRGAII